jgi:hypothetical protein
VAILRSHSRARSKPPPVREPVDGGDHRHREPVDGVVEQVRGLPEPLLVAGFRQAELFQVEPGAKGPAAAGDDKCFDRLVA